jgi:hypothetical protein
MTMVRTDLMELGPDALTALANPGFVKRAQKDVAAGALPALRQDSDGTVHALFADAVQTSMPPGVASTSITRRRLQLQRQRHVPASRDARAGLPGRACRRPGCCRRCGRGTG